jgi:hypothetical protein
MTTALHNIIGLNRSGKTTFLAALWHLIQAGEVATKLVLDKLDGDYQYLNRIAEAWRRCEEVPRTSMQAETSVSMHVHDPSGGRKSILNFPDLSGESFKRQVASRTCRKNYVESFAHGGGILLFVTADRPDDGLTILDLAPALEGEPAQEKTGAPKEWNPDLIPDQVRLVELLQFLQRPPFSHHHRRVSVIISAWDVLPNPKPAPDVWLARELPFLHQFLQTNLRSLNFRTYGVSAQGGSVRGSARDVLLAKRPSDRIECVGVNVEPHDLTAPIVWLMEDR